MKLFFIKLANLCAKLSVEEWSRCRLTRRIFRQCYRALMEWPARWHCRWNIYGDLFRGQQRDTYPYRKDRIHVFWRGVCNVCFAPWPECDDPGHYNLISDSLGFVIRRSPSYIAWKLYEALGKKLKIFPGGGHVNDAKNWDNVMKLNQFLPIEGGLLDYLSRNEAEQRAYFIGVAPTEGEFGQLYWYEQYRKEGFRPDYIVDVLYASTYEDFHHEYCRLDANHDQQITWYRVS